VSRMTIGPEFHFMKRIKFRHLMLSISELSYTIRMKD
jgi:hypothetical protein